MMNLPEGQHVWGSLYRPGVASWSTVDEVFTKRNLWALSAIRNAIDIQSPLGFLFNSAVLNSSRMYRHRETGGGGPAGNISIPQINREMNAFSMFAAKCQDLMTAAEEMIGQYKGTAYISTQSATSLAAIPNASIDYIFTDPPYSDKFPYGELNFIWEAWLNFDTHWHGDEDNCKSSYG